MIDRIRSDDRSQALPSNIANGIRAYNACGQQKAPGSSPGPGLASIKLGTGSLCASAQIRRHSGSCGANARRFCGRWEWPASCDGGHHQDPGPGGHSVDGTSGNRLSDAELEYQARALLAQLTLEEKLSLLSGDTPFWAGMVDLALNDASHRHSWPAGVVPRLGLKGLHFVDGPRGVVLAGGATTFPVPMARGASWDPELEERIGSAIGSEARSFGANWVAGVCVNLLRHPGWGRAQETYGEDPVHVGLMGAAMTRGLERHAIACVKHYALNSIDSSRFLVNVQVSRRALHELYLPQFHDCIAAGARSVMTAYNRVNGQWCSEHEELIHTVLKRRWGFRGLVVSDFIFGVRDGIAAVRAGLDLEMPFPLVLKGCLAEAVAAQHVSISRIDDAALRQLRLQLAVPQGDPPAEWRHHPAHRDLALEAARKSIVLLRNQPLADGLPVLPFNDLGSLAVVGRLAEQVNLGDRGSSDTRPPEGVVITPMAGLREACPGMAVNYSDGSSIPAAAALAARCDAAVVVVGLDWRLEGEHIHPGDIAPVLRMVPPPAWMELVLSPRWLHRLWQPMADGLAWLTSHASPRVRGDFAAGDRTDLALPADQQALIQAMVAVNPRTVVVFMGGGAILCADWQHLVPGLLVLWYPGEQGGHALADVLFGRVSPSGRMPFSVPVSPDSLPVFEPRAQQVNYDLWHGYRLLQRHHQPALYPFGYGLSYSTFHRRALHSDLQLSDSGEAFVRLDVAVRNLGPVDAAEVVQVYVEPPAGPLERPARYLVAFERIHLSAGEEREIALAIPLRRLACFDPECDGFVVQPGTHQLVVAEHVDAKGEALALDLQAEFIGP